jgi:hypothetical protein
MFLAFSAISATISPSFDAATATFTSNADV